MTSQRGVESCRRVYVGRCGAWPTVTHWGLGGLGLGQVGTCVATVAGTCVLVYVCVLGSVVRL